MAAKKKAAKKPKKSAVKRPKPASKPVSKPKKRPVAPSTRSKAAKKGWVTRRKKQVQKNQKRLKNAALARAKKPAVKKIRTADKTRKQLEAIIRKQEAEIKRAEEEIKRAEEENQRLRRIGQQPQAEIPTEWVPAVADEYLSREDGHITLEPSRARHDPDYDNIRRRLEQAMEDSEYDFDAECYDVADEYGYEVREIYTMFWSP